MLSTHLIHLDARGPRTACGINLIHYVHDGLWAADGRSEYISGDRTEDNEPLGAADCKRCLPALSGGDKLERYMRWQDA